MPDVNSLLQQAIQAARAGKDLTARDLFLDVVRLDPNNKPAWLWLIGLLDDLDDRIEACYRALAIDPSDLRVQKMLGGLLEQRRQIELDRNNLVLQTLDEIEALLKKGERATALELLRRATRDHGNIERAWLLLAEASPEMDEQTRALARAVKLNPKNETAALKLKNLRALQNDPYDLAHYYEEHGELNRALETYKKIALASPSRVDWDRVYANITRLERMKVEKIKHVSPALSIVRLAAGPPILYFVALLAHYGLNPLYVPFIMWLAFLVVILGSVLSALSSVRAHHRVWNFFGEEGTSGSRLARLALAVAGAALTIASFLPLASDSFERLNTFVNPLPFPF